MRAEEAGRSACAGRARRLWSASGARILGSLVHELRRRGGGLGCAAICSGGGQGDALILKV